MTEAATVAAAPEAPASLAGSALFGAAPAAAAAPAQTAAPDAAAQTTALTPEQQAAADSAKAAEPPPLKMPGKDASPEEWAAFYKQVGVPDTAEAYEVALPEGANPEEATLIQSMFKEANLLPEQAAKLVEIRNRLFAENTAAAAKAEEARIAALETQNKQQAAELTNEWGAKATENMEMARRGVTQFIDGDQAKQQAVISAMEQALGYKETIKFFHNIGKAIGEHDAAGLGVNTTGTSPKSMAERIYGPDPK